MGNNEIKEQNEYLRKQIDYYETEKKEREARYESERKEREARYESERKEREARYEAQRREREERYESERKEREDRYESQRIEYDNMKNELLNRLDERDRENKELLKRISNNEKIFKTTVMQTSILIQNLFNTPNPDIELIKSLNKLLETQTTILKEEDENYF